MKLRNLFAMAVVALAPASAMAFPADCLIGEVRYFSFNYAPQGYMPADGRVLPITNYNALFALLGTNYGGDGIRTFALPKIAPIEAGGGSTVQPAVCVDGLWPARPY